MILEKYFFQGGFIKAQRSYTNGRLERFTLIAGQRRLIFNWYKDSTGDIFYLKPLKVGQKRRQEIKLIPPKKYLKNKLMDEYFTKSYIKKHFRKFKKFENRTRRRNNEF